MTAGRESNPCGGTLAPLVRQRSLARALRYFYFDFTDLHSQRKAIGIASGQTPLYCLSCVFDCRDLGSTLRNASRQGWALGHDHAGFVPLKRDEQFHDFMLAKFYDVGEAESLRWPSS